MLCQNCGQKNADDCLFCVYCGAKVESSNDATIKSEVPPYGYQGGSLSSDFSQGETIFPGTPPEEEVSSNFSAKEEISYKTPVEENASSFNEEAQYSSPPPAEERKSSNSSSSKSKDYSNTTESMGGKEVRTNRFAIASIVLSTINILFCCSISTVTMVLFVPMILMPFLSSIYSSIIFGIQSIASIIIIIVGIIGRRQIKNSNGTQKGNGFALAAIIIEVIILIPFATLLILSLLGCVASTLIPILIILMGEGSTY